MSQLFTNVAADPNLGVVSCRFYVILDLTECLFCIWEIISCKDEIMFEKGNHVCEVLASRTGLPWLLCEESAFSHKVISPKLLNEGSSLAMQKDNISLLDIEERVTSLTLVKDVLIYYEDSLLNHKS